MSNFVLSGIQAELLETREFQTLALVNAVQASGPLGRAMAQKQYDLMSKRIADLKDQADIEATKILKSTEKI